MHQGAFNTIISLDNLFVAWQSYRKGKRSRHDVQEFEFRVEDNIFELHEDLKTGLYRPSRYEQFRITDPKPRIISKALVRDRLLHQAIYQILYPAFDRAFIFDSYSCRNTKGTHRAFKQVVMGVRKISRNYRGPCWAIKLDIQKFFDSVDHAILLELLAQRISDRGLMELLHEIIESFSFTPRKGMPLGNLTSQLFANIYLDPLDKFVKHRLKAKYYLRYADDFILLAPTLDEVLGYLVEINRFVKERLKLQIHSDKVILRKLRQGIDFVGYVALPHHCVLRMRTKRRILRRVNHNNLPSYLGLLRHCNGHTLEKRLSSILR